MKFQIFTLMIFIFAGTSKLCLAQETRIDENLMKAFQYQEQNEFLGTKISPEILGQFLNIPKQQDQKYDSACVERLTNIQNLTKNFFHRYITSQKDSGGFLTVKNNPYFYEYFETQITKKQNIFYLTGSKYDLERVENPKNTGDGLFQRTQSTFERTKNENKIDSKIEYILPVEKFCVLKIASTKDSVLGDTSILLAIDPEKFRPTLAGMTFSDGSYLIGGDNVSSVMIWINEDHEVTQIAREIFFKIYTPKNKK